MCTMELLYKRYNCSNCSACRLTCAGSLLWVIEENFISVVRACESRAPSPSTPPPTLKNRRFCGVGGICGDKKGKFPPAGSAAEPSIDWRGERFAPALL